MHRLLSLVAASFLLALPVLADGATVVSEWAALEAHAKARPTARAEQQAWMQKTHGMAKDLVARWEGKVQGEERFFLTQAYLILSQLERGEAEAHLKRAREHCAATLEAKPDHPQAKQLAGQIDRTLEQGAKRAEADAKRQALVGQPAPSLEADEVLDGETLTLESLRGKVVLVDFWATWCPPCRAVIPHLVELRKKHAEAGLEVVGVTRFYENGFVPEPGRPQKGQAKENLSQDEEREVNRQCAKALGIEYPIVFSSKAAASYFVSGIPQLVVIDRKGVVRHVKVGAGDTAELDRIVEECLAEKVE